MRVKGGEFVDVSVFDGFGYRERFLSLEGRGSSLVVVSTCEASTCGAFLTAFLDTDLRTESASGVAQTRVGGGGTACRWGNLVSAGQEAGSYPRLTRRAS